MFERLTPPEFVALIPSSPQQYSNAGPAIIGYTFQHTNGVYFRKGGGVCIDRKDAYIYIADTVEIVSRDGGWGNKSQGKFRAVYEGVDV